MFSGSSSLLIVILASALVFAIPIPVGEGDVVMVKPKHFEPRPSGVGSIGAHPAVVVSNPDASNKIKVAPVSHNHPGDPPTKPPSEYGLDNTGSVDVGPPKVVDANNVKGGKQAGVTPENLALLKGHINENCSDGQKLTRRDGTPATACKMRRKPAVHGVTKMNAPAANKAKAKKP